MEETTNYLCEAFNKGYAKKIESMGREFTLCEVKMCPMNYKEKILLNGKPKEICLVEGILTNEVSRKNNLLKLLPQKE